jgi:tripartite-type tricarboxylate transporter receptor subunit TctC
MTMRIGRNAGVAATVAALASIISVTASNAQDVYANKRISIVVGFGPGGGIDAYARVLAQHLGKHIPGHPAVLVVNMPGAAGLKAVMSLQNAASRDDTTIVAFNPALVVQSVLQPQRFKVNFADVHWLGSADGDLRICYMWAATGVKTWQDFQRRDPVIMANSGGGDSSIEQKIMRNLLGIKLKQVLGYGGSAEKQLAVERGEVDGDCGAWTGTPIDWIREKKINVVLKFENSRAEGLPDTVPFAGDLIASTSEQQVFRLLTAGSDIGRPYILSKATPPDRVQILRDAFDATMRDPDFLEEMHKRQLTIRPTTGGELQRKVRALYALPADVIQRAEKVMED